MIPWPFLFCQKPIVRAPVSTIAAVFGKVAQPVAGTVTGREYVNVPGPVPNGVAGAPLNASVTVTVLPTSVAGAPKEYAAVPVAEPCGAGKSEVPQLAVEVFVPAEPLGSGQV